MSETEKNGSLQLESIDNTLDIPDFLRRVPKNDDTHQCKNFERAKGLDRCCECGKLFPVSGDKAFIERISNTEIEPTIAEVLDLIQKLSAKQEDIERKKNELKQQIVNEIWKL